MIKLKTILSETEITTIKGINLESDIAIALLKLLKSKLSKLIVKIIKDYYGGGNIKNTYTSLYLTLSKHHIINNKILTTLQHKLNNKKFDEFISITNRNKVIDVLYKILLKGIIFDMNQNPILFANGLNDKEVLSLANKFSANRGKDKFLTMIDNNKKFKKK